MSSALSSSVGIVAYLALFGGVGILFLFVSLLVGRFVRPANPEPGKLEIYECGEPSIGSSFVQFDLRFYVVALLFIIFDVEVALFFPWATVFGKSTHLMDERFVVATQSSGEVVLTDPARHLYQELGVRGLEQKPSPAATQVPLSLRSAVADDLDEEARANRIAHAGARQLALITIVDILVFFAVLLVGFAYVWMRGDLDWVRAVTRDRGGADREPDVPVAAQETVLSA